MIHSSSSSKSLLRSYLDLRKAIGVIAVMLPFLLLIGNVVNSCECARVGASISSYYYTPMRNILVGSLSAIAVFLWTYKGYEDSDNFAGNIACIFALGIAFFPGEPDVFPSTRERFFGYVHLASATGFFLTLSYFALYLFPKSHGPVEMTSRKRSRNKVYRVCGYTMLVCMVLLAISRWLPVDLRSPPRSFVFWLESLAIVAFGVSWFTKGEGLLKDQEENNKSRPERKQMDNVDDSYH